MEVLQSLRDVKQLPPVSQRFVVVAITGGSLTNDGRDTLGWNAMCWFIFPFCPQSETSASRKSVVFTPRKGRTFSWESFFHIGARSHSICRSRSRSGILC